MSWEHRSTREFASRECGLPWGAMGGETIGNWLRDCQRIGKSERVGIGERAETAHTA